MNALRVSQTFSRVAYQGLRLTQATTINYKPLVALSVRNYSSEVSVDGLFVQIKNDMKSFMRNKERTKLAVVKSIISDITYAEKAQGKPVKSDSEIAVLIQSAIKKRKESIASFESAGREDLAVNEKEEVDILQSYLPEQLSEREIEAEVLKAIKDTGAQSVKDMGKVMKQIQLDPAVAPKSVVAELVKKILASAK
ncbi:hypothetical protein K7432_006459 [Basidiobolus ranarum]|uniref:Altered inheritance of mitochondria protein 41 n=1 Tax=Basidiobolus ranarum TaxID=34480 RepID=A0ABR2W1L0_9FUNG